MTNFAKSLGFAAMAFAATSASFAIANPARAETPVQARIAYGDLNLGTAAGQKSFALRVARAADTVCGSSAERLDPGVRRAARECRDTVARDARAAVQPSNTVTLASR